MGKVRPDDLPGAIATIRKTVENLQQQPLTCKTEASGKSSRGRGQVELLPYLKRWRVW